MALDQSNRVAVYGTVAESFKLTRAMMLPFVVLTVLFTLPVIGAEALGWFDSIYAFNQQAANDVSSVDLGEIPFGEVLLGLALGFFVLSGFGIFWYRYLLLGSQGALKFGIAELSSMILRFSGYGLLVTGVGMIVFMFATLLGCLVGGLICRLLGQSGNFLAYMVIGWSVILAYLWPLSIAARTALIFPAIAIGRPTSLAEAWATSKDSSGRLVWALLVAGVPLVLMSFGVHSALSAAVGVDFLAKTAASVREFWWASLLLSPIANLALAVALGVVAIAYRDLASRAPVAEPAAEARFAQ